MSTCISSQGEFSSHELGTGDQEFTCTLCGTFDEDACMATLAQVRASADEWWRLYDAELKRRPDVTAEQIPTEALEAAALKVAARKDWPPDWDEVTREWFRGLARDAIGAALPHLVTHHPARVLPSVEDVARREVTSPADLDALRESGVAGLYLFQRGGHTILAWETENGDLVGIRPWDEEDGQFMDSVPPATRETFAFAVRDLSCDQEEEFEPLTLLWHDGTAAAPTVQQVRAEALREAEALVRPRYRVEYAASSDVMTRAWAMQNGALHSAADRIARAAETEGE